MDEEKKISVVAIAILAILVIFAIAYFVMSDSWSENKTNTNNNVGYSTVSISEAYDLINKSLNQEINLTIVDCRGLEGCSICQYNRGHLPGAIRTNDALSLENTTNDILVYSVNGSVGEEFCLDLVNEVKNVTGKIYNLEGGWEAWKSHHDTYGWPPIET